MSSATVAADSTPTPYRLGSEDWNDGMNRVGSVGRGESTWLGFFLHGVLLEFAPLCEARGDQARAERYSGEARRLGSMLEQTWDGEWYRRGYYDDGAHQVRLVLGGRKRPVPPVANLGAIARA